MVVGEVSTPTDVLVIGGGPGGYAAAIKAAQLGQDVTLVERDAVGGTCLNVGCIPSKVMIHAADIAHGPISAAGTGISVSTAVNVPELQSHIRSVVSDLTGGVNQLLANSGVTVMQGTARFSRPRRAAVVCGADVHHIEFKHAIIATGSRPIELPNLPYSDARITDSTGAIFGFDQVPSELVIVGGGYIGVELGTAWHKLGAHVTIVELADRLLPSLDPRLSRMVQRRCGELGIAVMTGTRAHGMADGGLLVGAGAGTSAEHVLPADQVVVCVGRRPNTDDLGLDIVGITPTETGHIMVDESRRATKRILAIGDVTDGPALAHKATAEAEVAARTVAGLDATFDPAVIPAVVFSDPEIATVGLTRAEAEAAGAEVTAFSMPLGASGRARTLGAKIGQLELIADSSGTILGANLAGPNVSEIVAEIALAIEMAATVEELAATIHPHPTMSEGLFEAARGLLG